MRSRNYPNDHDVMQDIRVNLEGRRLDVPPPDPLQLLRDTRLRDELSEMVDHNEMDLLILLRWADGESDNSVGRSLKLDPRTVRKYRNAAMLKARQGILGMLGQHRLMTEGVTRFLL